MTRRTRARRDAMRVSPTGNLEDFWMTELPRLREPEVHVRLNLHFEIFFACNFFKKWAS